MVHQCSCVTAIGAPDNPATPPLSPRPLPPSTPASGVEGHLFGWRRGLAGVKAPGWGDRLAPSGFGQTKLD
ncbi:hypothetical protein E2C01_030029 [Portunus trituberculatus]|uniref:Uncharacterized protein n=1 Tax=Portunus trituberculatus TaxID=210409 RepID=A0A5B7ETT6_PORTR|nr:hypothetical protein [Portunus trituberculatus]